MQRSIILAFFFVVASDQISPHIISSNKDKCYFRNNHPI